MKRLLPIILAAVALSCTNPTPFLYRVVTFGNPQEDLSLLADDGRRYVFPNAANDFDWNGAKRVFAVFDVTKAVSDSVYEAILNNFSIPLFKAPMVVSGPDKADTLGTADINVSDIWYSGGCLNMINSIKVLASGEDKHTVNLVTYSKQLSRDTVNFEMRHLPDPPATAGDAISNYNFYSTFPLKDVLAEGEHIIKVSWNWEGASRSFTGKVKIAGN